MSLDKGARLGPYEIVEPIGAGGMGEVYLARDTRLNREVAVKVLSGQLSKHAEVRQRFEREARAASSLNHPNICTVHDIGSHEGTDFIVMERLAGESLDSRLKKGPLPADEVLRIGVQIADALDKAHRKGLVHRDIKPGNIMITKSGAKLLDFGLAKSTALEMAGSDLTASPTMSKPLTAEGAIMGTFQYMAPEQLEGGEVDARTDIFALGLVLYEMAAGKRAFEGKNQASLIAAILERAPEPMATLRPASPPALERLVSRCLEKDPEKRWQSAGDLRIEMERILAGDTREAASAARPGTGSGSRIAWALAIVLPILAAAATWVLVPRPSPDDGLVIRASIPPPEKAPRLILSGDAGAPPTLSPDGKSLVFGAVGLDGKAMLWLRSLASPEARPLPGTENATYPFWAPDGRQIGFFAPEKLKRIDLANGTVFTICDASQGKGGTWNADGTIVFAAAFQGPLLQVAASLGTPEPMTSVDKAIHTTHRWPQFLPDGRRFIFFAGNHSDPLGEHSGIYLGSIDRGEPRLLVQAASNGIFALGRLLYMHEGTLVARPFDPDAGTFTGAPLPTREKVHLDATTWVMSLSASSNGLLAYERSGSATGSKILWLDRAGELVRSTGENISHLNFRLSPDGALLATESQVTPNGDIWIHDVARDTATRLTFDPRDEVAPIWSPDGKQVAFGADRGQDGKVRYGLFVKDASGAGQDREILAVEEDLLPLDWSPDGRYILIERGHYGDERSRRLWVAPTDGSADPLPLSEGSASESGGRFSPDGRFVAYDSNESGRDEVYVTPFTPGQAQRGSRWQISTAGGSEPRWRGDGRELYYVRPDNMILAVSIDLTGDAPRVGKETPLFRIAQRQDLSPYDVTKDGQLFLLNALAADNTDPIVLVSSWTADLGAR